MPMRIGDAIPTFEGATEGLNELQETADDYVRHFIGVGLGMGQTQTDAELNARIVAAGLLTAVIACSTSAAQEPPNGSPGWGRTLRPLSSPGFWSSPRQAQRSASSSRPSPAPSSP